MTSNSANETSSGLLTSWLKKPERTVCSHELDMSGHPWDAEDRRASRVPVTESRTAELIPLKAAARRGGTAIAKGLFLVTLVGEISEPLADVAVPAAAFAAAAVQGRFDWMKLIDFERFPKVDGTAPATDGRRRSTSNTSFSSSSVSDSSNKLSQGLVEEGAVVDNSIAEEPLIVSEIGVLREAVTGAAE